MVKSAASTLEDEPEQETIISRKSESWVIWRNIIPGKLHNPHKFAKFAGKEVKNGKMRSLR